MKKQITFFVFASTVLSAFARVQRSGRPQIYQADSTCTKTITTGSEITMSYDSGSQLINIKSKVPANSYFAIGFGSSMTNTDMSYWLNDGTESGSVQQQVYSTGESEPQLYTDSYNCYTTVSSVFDSSDNSVTITQTRPLDCNHENTYVIPLDTSIDMISAFKTADTGETITFSYHGGNGHIGYSWYFNSDGTCAEPAPTPTDPCTLSLNNGDSTVKMTYDSDKQLVNYLV